MIKDIYSKKRLESSWVNLLQQTICYEFEKIARDLGINNKVIVKALPKIRMQGRVEYFLKGKYVGVLISKENYHLIL